MLHVVYIYVADSKQRYCVERGYRQQQVRSNYAILQVQPQTVTILEAILSAHGD